MSQPDASQSEDYEAKFAYFIEMRSKAGRIT